MMRLPSFRILAPRTLAEAAAALADLGDDAAVLAGGTDLLPNMKRRQRTPGAVIALSGVAALRERSGDPARGLTLGALTRLTDIERDRGVAEAWPALARAVASIATPPIRNLGTIGGNLCLDTRCGYWDQGAEWREAIGGCLKGDGDTCWVATSSPRCWAVASADSAPVLCALGAEVTLASPGGERRIPVTELFADDGLRPLTLRRGELVAAVHVPAPADGERSAYVKLRRRGSFDFPLLGVAVRARLVRGAVEAASVFLTGVGSRPHAAPAAAARLQGNRLDDEAAIHEAAALAAQVAKPMQNADLSSSWRKKVTAEHVARALRALAARGGP